MARPEPSADPVVPPGLVPPGTTELGIDIVRVERIARATVPFIVAMMLALVAVIVVPWLSLAVVN